MAGADYPVQFAGRIAKALTSAADLSGEREQKLLRSTDVWALSLFLALFFFEKGPDRADLPGYKRDAERFAQPIRDLIDDALADRGAIDLETLWLLLLPFSSVLERPLRLAYQGNLHQAAGAFKFAIKDIKADNLEAAIKSDTYLKATRFLLRKIGERKPPKSGDEEASLSDGERCKIYLMSRGHSAAEAEAICKGPGRTRTSRA